MVVSLFMGPGRERWAPQTWEDVVTAAAGGLLDERHHIELKKAIAPPTKDTNRELAKDLAALACDGGVMIIGVVDKDHGQAGDVVGTALTGLAERINQVAGSPVLSPPVVVRTEPLPHPTTPDHGCLLVIVDASVDGPHMVNQRYYGRNDTGTRVLSDLEVRRYMLSNAQRQEDFAGKFTETRASSPLGGPGVLHLLFRPRSAQRGAIAHRLSHANVLVHEVTRDLPNTGQLWDLAEDLKHLRRVVRGVLVTDISDRLAADFQLHQRASEVDNFDALRIWDDGTLLLSCSRMVYGLTGAPDGAQKALSVAGMAYRTEQAAIIAGRLADAAGYGGQWDIGLYIDGLLGCRPGIEGHYELVGHYGALFPESDHEELATTTSDELNRSPRTVVHRLVREIFLVLGAEQQLDVISPSTSV